MGPNTLQRIPSSATIWPLLIPLLPVPIYKKLKDSHVALSNLNLINILEGVVKRPESKANPDFPTVKYFIKVMGSQSIYIFQIQVTHTE